MKNLTTAFIIILFGILSVNTNAQCSKSELNLEETKKWITDHINQAAYLEYAGRDSYYKAYFHNDTLHITHYLKAGNKEVSLAEYDILAKRLNYGSTMHFDGFPGQSRFKIRFSSAVTIMTSRGNKREELKVYFEEMDRRNVPEYQKLYTEMEFMLEHLSCLLKHGKKPVKKKKQ